jgi:hypothetical protein
MSIDVCILIHWERVDERSDRSYRNDTEVLVELGSGVRSQEESGREETSGQDSQVRQEGEESIARTVHVPSTARWYQKASLRCLLNRNPGERTVAVSEHTLSDEYRAARLVAHTVLRGHGSLREFFRLFRCLCIRSGRQRATLSVQSEVLLG